MKNTKIVIFNVIMIILITFSITLMISVNWLYNSFGNLSLEELFFQIKVPMTGANNDFVFDYMIKALPFIILFSFLYCFIVFKVFKNKKYYSAKRMKGVKKEKSTNLAIRKKIRVNRVIIGRTLSTLIILVIGCTYFLNRTQLIDFINREKIDSSLIETEFVDPKNVSLEFPEEKRNLIYIYLESMETTLFSKENGGAYDESIIPELEEIATENISFNGSEEWKGLYSLPGTTWTTGAMVAHTMGLPLKVPINANAYGEYDLFLPGAYGLGEILDKEGYNQMLMIGSKAKFGGRNNLFMQHGNYEIFDYVKVLEDGRKTKEDFVWWGFSDNDLFEYAKEEITRLSEQDKPFNFTMLTVDTHHINGYKCEDCEDKYGDQYLNVLACSSKKTKAFLDWIQDQDFYDNTTVIICGDHPSMQPMTFDQIESEGYTRTVYNAIINSAVETDNKDNKMCSTMDMFPTTLASLGVKIDGDRLGLGTNLFSDKETLMSRYSLDYLSEQLLMNSKFYKKSFLYQK